MPDFCKDLGRCYFQDINDSDNEGEVVETKPDEVVEPELKKMKSVKVPEKLTKAHREFLKDVINF